MMTVHTMALHLSVDVSRIAPPDRHGVSVGEFEVLDPREILRPVFRATHRYGVRLAGLEQTGAAQARSTHLCGAETLECPVLRLATGILDIEVEIRMRI